MNDELLIFFLIEEGTISTVCNSGLFLKYACRLMILLWRSGFRRHISIIIAQMLNGRLRVQARCDIDSDTFCALILQ